MSAVGRGRASRDAATSAVGAGLQPSGSRPPRPRRAPGRPSGRTGRRRHVRGGNRKGAPRSRGAFR